MHIFGKRNVLVFLILFLCSNNLFGQDPKSMVSKASGDGTITLGKEQFKLHEVVVKLFEDGTAELNLVSDITVFVNGKWARTDNANTIDLKITSSSATSLEGSGKLFLRDDHKSIAGLKLQMANKTSSRSIKVDFTAN